jgi:DNA polymerase I-like protein with 3'-5' exonuclease and polymerase domains
VGVIGFDTETKDGGIAADRGSGWPWGDGYICGVSAAYHGEGGAVQSHYFPIRHPDTQNFDPTQVFQWVRDHIAAGVRFATQNGLYDWGWLRADAGIAMPSSEQLEETQAAATLVDENRHRYSLEALCKWRGILGKDDALLHEGCAALGLIPKRKKSFNPQPHIWQLPAHYVGPYAEQDAASTLLLFESLALVLEHESTHSAYRLEVDLLPMVAAMRRRGIRIDIPAAERARDLLLQKRDAAFAELSEKLGINVGMEEIGRNKWLADTFDAHGIKYPRTEKGNPSFTAGSTGWMHKHSHWLPLLIVKADKYNNAAVNVLENYILNHVVKGRVHAEIHPHRSDDGGTRSFRFSYSNPPLQLMPSRDEELAPLIRGVFLPEEGEVWAKPDISQQEFRFLVHYAVRHKLTKANEVAELYRTDPNTDFHQLATTWSGLDRTSAKATNFARIYGAGVRKFASMISKSMSEAQTIYDRYDRDLPFMSELTERCQRAVRSKGHLVLYGGARRHWNNWAPGGKWEKGAGPCSWEEAQARVRDIGHPWYGQRLYRADTRKALNALIQGSAAYHTKLWMRACWREGVTPLLQMHDSLDCSVSSPEQAELVAQLGRDAVQLEVPMQVDLRFGRNWGDAKHTWAELHNGDAAQAPIDNAEPAGSSAYQIDWAAALERDFPRMNGGGVAAAAMDEAPASSPRDDDAFIHARMAEEGVPWESGAPTSTADDPQLSTPNQPQPTKGNGAGDGYPASDRDDVGEKVDEFIYHDMKNTPWLKVVKRRSKDGKKYFPQYHLENGTWVKGKPTGPAIPYQVRTLLTAPANATVEIAEGEKDALTLTRLGFIATTNPGGACKWAPELNRWFAGFARANIYEDNDEAGRKHAAKVASELCGIIPDIRIITFHELPEHGDVSDWMALGKTKEDLLARIDQAPKFIALESVRAADVEIEDFEWVWPNRFARGKIGLIVGMPEEGKGQLLSDIIARITRGGTWPCNEGAAPLGNAILLSAEDDIKDTIVPRLLAAGADLKRITILKMIREAGKERMFSLISDLHALKLKVLEAGGVVLIVIDPISAYFGIGKVDSFRATDVRAILSPLKQFAEDLEIAVIGVLHFNKKTDVTNVMLRVSDSLAYSAASRHVYGIVGDPENHRRLFVRGKNNIAREEQKTLAFGIEECEVGVSKKTKRVVRAPHIVWHDEPVDITATEALRAAAESKSPSARETAKQFIKTLLSNGPIGSKDVQEAGKENGISPSTLRRAAEDLKVNIKKDGPKNDKGEITWRWHLPNEEDET